MGLSARRGEGRGGEVGDKRGQGSTVSDRVVFDSPARQVVTQ